jgi:[methyl-Co(III) methanol-specific corrinoid protein]:coenzyme M methyltransferase
VSDASSRQIILELLQGRRPAQPPVFAGLISLTLAGLEARGLTLSDIHHDATQLALAAASTPQLTGLASAVLPGDLCVEAEALGARVDFRRGDPMPGLPRLAETVAESSREFRVAAGDPITQRGRLPVVGEALRRLRAEVGEDVAIGAFIPGPLTLAMHVVDIGPLLLEVAEAPAAVAELLDRLVPVLAEVGDFYRASGADFLTVHEMGGSPGFIGPRPFEEILLPRLQDLLTALPGPRVLSVCGRTNRGLPLLAQCGADALSVDQTNDVAQSRAALGPEPLLFGNLDPVGVLAEGDPATVQVAAERALAAGVDALWPGCDLWPGTPLDNLKALAATAQAKK